jgi:hypothetical protein
MQLILQQPVFSEANSRSATQDNSRPFNRSRRFATVFIKPRTVHKIHTLKAKGEVLPVLDYLSTKL